MMFDNYDVLVEVTTHGICSPYNSHSYKGSLILLPCVCSSCKQTIYPLITSAVTCIRCHSVAHRGICMRNTKSICPKITPKEMKRGLSSGESFRYTECSDSSYNIVEKKKEIEPIPESTTNLKEHVPIPSPGSADCIWSKHLQLLADKQSHIAKYKDISLLSRSNSFGDDFFLALDTLVKSVLEDVKTFPGEVCSVFHSLFLSTHFGHDRNADRNTLTHARQCLDTVACAVLSVLPDDITAGNYIVAEFVSNAVDRHVLGMSHRAMYYKVFLAAQLMSDTDDRKISFLSHQRSQENNKNKENKDNDEKTEKKGNKEDKGNKDDRGGNDNNGQHHHCDSPLCVHCELVKSTLLAVTELISPRDKLSQLRKALQQISNYTPVPPVPPITAISAISVLSLSEDIAVDVSVSPLLDSLGIDSGAKDVDYLPLENIPMVIIPKRNVPMEKVPENNVPKEIVPQELSESRPSVRSGSIDADTLVEVVSTVLLASITPNPETCGEKLNVFWFAECAYVESMMREGDWSLGIESYALATVMQALQSIIH